MWDSNANREATSLVQRKQAFTEIANSLSNQEVRLTAKDVEKQWKNLKVTKIYMKKAQNLGHIQQSEKESHCR